MTSSQANSAAAGPADAVRQEQAYVDMLYGLLDAARERTERALAGSLASGGAGGTLQARLERDLTASEQSRRLAQLNAVERGMVFGRHDGRTDGRQPAAPSGGEPPGPGDPAGPSGGEPPGPGEDQPPATLYIGRIGLRDDEHEPRLIDWRAPAARPFYAATPKDPDGLIR